MMTKAEAADSMRQTARKLDTWANATEKLTPQDMAQLGKTFRREALRLRNDAAVLDASSGAGAEATAQSQQA